jgi:hypothetical protein
MSVDALLKLETILEKFLPAGLPSYGMNFPSLAALTGEAGLKVGKFQSNIAIEQGTHGREEEHNPFGCERS